MMPLAVPINLTWRRQIGLGFIALIKWCRAGEKIEGKAGQQWV